MLLQMILGGVNHLEGRELVTTLFKADVQNVGLEV